MAPKSWITAPVPADGRLASGAVVFQGVALGGLNAVAKVEVSIDGGASWQAARLVGPDLGRFAWRQFALKVKLPPGTHTLASRVTDARGTVQDEARIENNRGYSNASWRDHAVQVTVS